MLIAFLAATYLMLALAIVLAVDRIAGLMFRVPEETVAPRAFRLVPQGLLRKAFKIQI